MATLRGKKADQATGHSDANSLRLNPRTYGNLKRLATSLGQPLSTTVDLLVQVALVDGELRKRVGMLSVATGLR